MKKLDIENVSNAPLLDSVPDVPYMPVRGHYVGGTSARTIEAGRGMRLLLAQRNKGESILDLVGRLPDLAKAATYYGLTPEYPLDPGWEERTGAKNKRRGRGVLQAIGNLVSKSNKGSKLVD